MVRYIFKDRTCIHAFIYSYYNRNHAASYIIIPVHACLFYTVSIRIANMLDFFHIANCQLNIQTIYCKANI